MGKMLCLMVFVAAGMCAVAGPIVDGRFDLSEGYSTGYLLDLTLDDYGLAPGAGELWLHQDAATSDVYFALKFAPALVDNTYGANAIGWGSDAPSGKDHKFKDLKGSDKAQFQFTNSLGEVVFDFDMDYFSEIGSGADAYRSGGATEGDGTVHTGDAAYLLEYGSSLGYSFAMAEQAGADISALIVNSPASDTSYSPNLDFPYWQFPVVYEGRVDGTAFANGFGGVTIPIAHVSPNKLGANKVYPEIGDPITEESHDPSVPEPTTVLLFGSAFVLLTRVRRRKRRLTHDT